MFIHSWIDFLNRSLAMSSRGTQRRRKRASSIAAGVCQIENLEGRSMLSAGPVVTLAAPGPLTVTESAAPTPVAAGATVTDAGVANFNGGTLTESITANAGAPDHLAITNQGTGTGQIGVSGSNVQFEGVTIGTFSGGTGSTPLVVNLNANATVPAVQALQDAITFQTGDNPTSMLPRTFQTVISDGPIGTGITSTAVTETINVVEANPTVTLNAVNTTVDDSAAVKIAPNATITSPETHNLAGGTLTVSLTNATSRDRLEIRAPKKANSGVSVSGNQVSVNHVVVGTVSGGTGTTPLVITFNSHASVSDAQAIARTITFRSIGHATHTTDVHFALTDGDGGVSNTASSTLTITHGRDNDRGGADGDRDDRRHSHHHGRGRDRDDN